jgi:hypothetical protein
MGWFISTTRPAATSLRTGRSGRAGLAMLFDIGYADGIDNQEVRRMSDALELRPAEAKDASAIRAAQAAAASIWRAQPRPNHLASAQAAAASIW